MHADLGRGCIVAGRGARRHSEETTPQRSMVNARLHGVSRNQFMACHGTNHINIAYVPDSENADQALAVKAVMFQESGTKVHSCGDIRWLSVVPRLTPRHAGNAARMGSSEE
jgi:hypothetical protein